MIKRSREGYKPMKWEVRKYLAYVICDADTILSPLDEAYTYEPTSNKVSPAWAEGQYWANSPKEAWSEALKLAKKLNERDAGVESDKE